jgi:hypothetical protein
MITSTRRIVAVAALVASAVVRAAGSAPPATPGEAAMNAVADDYVRLVLAVGRHDPNYVDAYYGPPTWKAEAELGSPVPVEELRARTRELMTRLDALPRSARRTFLARQLAAVDGFLRRLGGERMTLAQEARALFDVDPPVVPRQRFSAARARLEALLPGKGDLAGRVQSFRARFRVPAERLPAVVDAALAELRRRTLALVTLPPGESFSVRYVTGKPWGAYNWYQGSFRSVIDVNTDIPIEVDNVLGVLAHEGYPGHHVYNVLLEDRLVRAKGWREFTVYPLYSPQSLIAEGTANAARRIIMDDAARRAFLREVLMPAAGLPTADLDRYLRVLEALRPFRYAPGVGAEMLLDEGKPDAEVVKFLVEVSLEAPERARKSLDFDRVYRSYVFNYTAGLDLVERWVGTGSDRAERFFDLLQHPVVPSELEAVPARPGAPG